MNRLSLNQTRVEELRGELQPLYPGKDEPLPGTALKLDDDVEWLGVLQMRVLWGYETADYFHALCPDIGDGYSYFDGIYINDRAPADTNETPMPIYPQQAQQKQHGKPHDPKRALQDLLKRLSPESAKKVREIVKAKRPELL